MQWIKEKRVILLLVLALAPILAVTPGLAMAQGTAVAFAGLKTDPTVPVQIQSDTLAINQTDGTALFTGNVIVTQGDMKLQAQTVKVNYSADQKAIQSLHADGGVTIAAGTEAAEAETADYLPATGDLTMLGHVLLTQGQSVISGEKLVMSLITGTGTMEGRVTTTFAPAAASPVKK